MKQTPMDIALEEAKFAAEQDEVPVEQSLFMGARSSHVLAIIPVLPMIPQGTQKYVQSAWLVRHYKLSVCLNVTFT